MPVMKRSIPAIARLDYIDLVLASLREGQVRTVDDARIVLGRHVEELAFLGEAHAKRDWRNSGAYRDTVAETLRLLAGWGLIEPVQVGDSSESFELTRQNGIGLTEQGRSIGDLGPGARRDDIGRRLLESFPSFRELIGLLDDREIVIPEMSDSVVREKIGPYTAATSAQDGWVAVSREALERVSEAASRVRAHASPSETALADEIGKYVRRRFASRTPSSQKDLTGTVNKAIAKAFLHTAGFDGDYNAFDRCLRWGRDLFVLNDGRHVIGVNAWLSWATGRVRRIDASWSIERRKVPDFRNRIEQAILRVYRELANARQPASTGPLIPIYEVRESAAFEVRVSDEAVDRVIGEMSQRVGPDAGPRAELHYADLRTFAPSARPFRLAGKKYFYLSMAHLSDRSDDREKEHVHGQVG